jgi:endonuclease/exonuclease/phosphatase family metal-dependent hydrolase
MSNILRVSNAAAARFGIAALLLSGWCLTGFAADSVPTTITVLTRNVDAGTDLGYILAAGDETSFARGMAQTMAELQASNFQQRAVLLAAEIGGTMPDLIALQEVTLWRTGPLLRPPATTILYDQLDQILAELARRNLHYGVVAVQSELDAEAPVPTGGIDLRITDRDVILARLDLPQSQFDLFNVTTHRFRSAFSIGSPILGQLAVPCGWMTVDVVANGSKFRFVNTHLQTPIAGISQAEQVQRAQADELLANLLFAGIPVVLAGDFNSNAEPGPEHTGTAQRIVNAGYTDAWKSAHPGDPGYTWPLFGEDQNAGTTVPNERIDLIFAGGLLQRWFGNTPAIVTAERIGTTPPYASDHAGLLVKIRLK